MHNLHGIYAPVLTPVDASGAIDTARAIDFSRDLLVRGCHGLVPFGTTSEATAFSVDERMAFIEALVGAGVEPSRLIVGAGCCAVTDSARLSAHAAELGCAGVLLLPPFYFKGVSDEGIFRAVAETIERASNAGTLRILLYHIPQIAVVGYSLPLVQRLVEAFPGVVVGIKDSSGDWENLRALLDGVDDFRVFAGTELLLARALERGGAGTITAVANVVPEQLRAFYDGWRADSTTDELAGLERNAVALRGVLRDYAAIPALKQIVAHQRRDPAWTRVRPPLVEMERAEAEQLLAQTAAASIELTAGEAMLP